ncbi:MAG: hypothetical protein R3F11_21300 [Verrucomicrobiales bacterium]
MRGDPVRRGLIEEERRVLEVGAAGVGSGRCLGSTRWARACAAAISPGRRSAGVLRIDESEVRLREEIGAAFARQAGARGDEDEREELVGVAQEFGGDRPRAARPGGGGFDVEHRPAVGVGFQRPGEGELAVELRARLRPLRQARRALRPPGHAIVAVQADEEDWRAGLRRDARRDALRQVGERQPGGDEGGGAARQVWPLSRAHRGAEGEPRREPRVVRQQVADRRRRDFEQRRIGRHRDRRLVAAAAHQFVLADHLAGTEDRDGRPRAVHRDLRRPAAPAHDEKKRLAPRALAADFLALIRRPQARRARQRRQRRLRQAGEKRMRPQDRQRVLRARLRQRRDAMPVPVPDSPGGGSGGRAKRPL